MNSQSTFSGSVNPRLLSALLRFEEAAIANGADPATFGPPIREAEVAGAMISRGLAPHPDVITLYGWHDPYFRGDLAPHTWDQRLLSLSAACDTFDGWIEMDSHYTSIDTYGKWADRWWPVAANAVSNEPLSIDTTTGQMGLGGAGEGSTYLFQDHPTLTDLVELWATVHEEGLYIRSGEGFEMDEVGLELRYGQRFNGAPGVPPLASLL